MSYHNVIYYLTIAGMTALLAWLAWDIGVMIGQGGVLLLPPKIFGVQ